MTFLALSLPLLLAEIDPLTDPQSYQSLGFLLLALGGLFLVANQLMAAVLNWRKLREPEPATGCNPQECMKLKVLEAEIRAVEMRMEKRLGEHLGSISTRLLSLETTLTHVVRDFNYVLGKIDGRQDGE